MKDKSIYLSIRNYFIAGLLVWFPIWATLALVRFIIKLFDSSLTMLPYGWQPMHWFGGHIPGLGIGISILILIITGFLVTHWLGHHLVQWGEACMRRIPLIGSIYQAFKQVLVAIVATDSQSFRKVLLVEYPRKGLWSLGFLTATTSFKPTASKEPSLLTVFIPTTPNPTSGFIVAVPESETQALDMSVEAALRMIISLGVVQAEAAPSIDNQIVKE